MSIESALRAILVANTPVNTALGGRIYPTRTPDNATFPCASYQRVSTQREHTLESAGNFTTCYFQIDIWTPRVSGAQGGADLAREIARKIQTALDGYRGIISSVDIQGILSENETHGYENDIEVYRVTQQWRIMFREG